MIDDRAGATFLTIAQGAGPCRQESCAKDAFERRREQTGQQWHIRFHYFPFVTDAECDQSIHDTQATAEASGENLERPTIWPTALPILSTA
ncbi:hypothetical protein ERN12_08395 [Rhodobacteraceae bacterium]|nr:hypothetical protein ERN12_08395 [Paracoccaceae bacterium]